MQLLKAAVFARHGELGALQDGLAAGHVAVHLCEVHVKPDGTTQAGEKEKTETDVQFAGNVALVL